MDLFRRELDTGCMTRRILQTMNHVQRALGRLGAAMIRLWLRLVGRTVEPETMTLDEYRAHVRQRRRARAAR
jgi:hypothetical protein